MKNMAKQRGMISIFDHVVRFDKIWLEAILGWINLPFNLPYKKQRIRDVTRECDP